MNETFALVTECMLAAGATGPELADGFFSVDDYNYLATANQRNEEFSSTFHSYRACRDKATRQTGYPLP